MSLNKEDSLESLRLGKCEICLDQNAKYTCPKCEVKSCCLRCLNIHKVELNCNGIRDKTKFVPLRQMTDRDFMSDYYFLEDCTHFLANRKRDKLKRQRQYNKFLSTSWNQLRNAAIKRKTKLKIFNFFTRHKENSTNYDNKRDIIYWHIEWIFVNANNLRCIDKHCSEDIKVSELLNKYLEVNSCKDLNSQLQFYQSKGIGKIQILLKAEGILSSKTRFYKIDCTKSIKENLSCKTIVEFPSFHVIYDLQPEAFDIIDSDDDVETETKVHTEKFEKAFRQHRKETEHQFEQTTDVKNNANVQQNKEQRSKPYKSESTIKNFLFTDDNLLDEISSDSDECNEEHV